MRKLSEQLVTKDQLETIYTAWGVTASVPRKADMEVIAFPNKEHAQVTYTPHTNDYGIRLYLIEFFAH
jgi:hypothetical protein